MSTGTATAAFFERVSEGVEFLPAKSYRVGLRPVHPDAPAATFTLPAELVDRTVLTGAQLSVWLSAEDGRLMLDGAGVDDEALEAAVAAGPMRAQTLLSLVEACLDPEHLAMEEDPVGGLTALKAQLTEALAKVDGALARLQPG